MKCGDLLVSPYVPRGQRPQIMLGAMLEKRLRGRSQRRQRRVITARKERPLAVAVWMWGDSDVHDRERLDV